MKLLEPDDKLVRVSTIIECGVCKLRPWRSGDAEAIVGQANNRRVSEQLRDRFPHPYTAADAKRFLKHNVDANPVTNFAIEVEGEVAGGVGLIVGTDIERIAAELGYWLGESYWGRGIATAAIRGMVDHAFREFQLTRIFAIPFVENVASARALEKAGFVREALMRKSAIKYGVIRDQYLYAIVR